MYLRGQALLNVEFPRCFGVGVYAADARQVHHIRKFRGLARQPANTPTSKVYGTQANDQPLRDATRWLDC